MPALWRSRAAIVLTEGKPGALRTAQERSCPLLAGNTPDIQSSETEVGVSNLVRSDDHTEIHKHYIGNRYRTHADHAVVVR